MISDLGSCTLVSSRLVVIVLCAYAIYVVMRYDMEPRRRSAGGHVLGGCLALIGIMGYLLAVGEVTSGLDQVVVNIALGVSLYGIAAFVRVTGTGEFRGPERRKTEVATMMFGNNLFGRAVRWVFGADRVRLKDIAAACLMAEKAHPDGTPGVILQDAALRYLAARYQGAGEARLRALIDRFVADAKEIAR